MRLSSKWDFSALQNEQVRPWTARTRVTSVSLTEDSHPEIEKRAETEVKWNQWERDEHIIAKELHE